MKKKKLTKAHYHEFIDRAAIIATNIDDYLINHPVAKRNKKIMKRLLKLNSKLWDVYNDAGQNL